ncbi:Kelch repeat type 1 and Kelch repeat type 2 and Fibronectin domain containing protein [Aphelenchoides fujianensis]|nr:Kelch repeat type 1 and Kelch repeat type 2 and Fibronectin domain containing protein [Aphelenchoides fujianensis]
MEEGEQVIPAKWSRVPIPAGPQPLPRHGHKMVAIKEFLVIFGGGNEGIVNDLYVFNTNDKLWYKPSVRGELPPGLAAFGMCTDGLRIFIFGGMVDRNVYSNDLYELDARRWEYKHILPQNRQAPFLPEPRFAHSFNIDSEGTGYVFGGMTFDARHDHEPRKLNDFFRVRLQSAMGHTWEELETDGRKPSPRESHTAVIFERNGQKQLFVYGGMDGERRLSDIWACDLHTFLWTEIEQLGVAPLGRSLHTAVVIDERMFVFGGWVSMEGEEVGAEGAAPQWKCSNDLAAFNLLSNTWEKFGEKLIAPGESLPKARAGHAAAVVHSRMYVWSGRDGIRKLMNAQLCCKDMFLLDTKPPFPPTHLQLIRATLEGVEIQWPAVPTADSYILQTKRVPPLDERSAQQALARAAAGKPVGQVPPQNGHAGVAAKALPNQNDLSGADWPSNSGESLATGENSAPGAKPNDTLPPAGYVYKPTENSSLNQMPNNILDEAFNDSEAPLSEPSTAAANQSTAEGGEQSTANETNQLMDPAEISLADPVDPQARVGDENAVPEEPQSTPTTARGADRPADVPADPPAAPATGVDENDPTPAPAAVATSSSASTDAAAPSEPTAPPVAPTEAVVPPEAEDVWHDVAEVKGTYVKVTHYFVDGDSEDGERQKAPLQPGVQYRFRVASVNTFGQSTWSPVATFRTCVPGFPGAPSSIKISKAQECAMLNWAPPAIPNGVISEYSVYLAMRGATENTNAFMRVYVGKEPRCTVDASTLHRAHVETNPKPAVIFRIAARNEKGYGPATQIRWLQDNWANAPLVRSAAFSSGAPSSLLASSSSPYAKRVRLGAD